MQNIQMPKTVEELQAILKIAIEEFQGSPVNNLNKLNEVTAKSLGFKNWNALAPKVKVANNNRYYAYLDCDNYLIIEDYTLEEEHIIDPSVYQCEEDELPLVGYMLYFREEAIEMLQEEITKAEPEALKKLKNNLNYLKGCNTDFVFKDVSTHKFISRNQNPEQFISVCEEFIDINQKYRSGKLL